MSSRLRVRREALGLSQSELAQAVGLSRQSVNAIETGRTTPAVDVALRLARAVEASVEELFGDVAPEPLLSAEAFGSHREGRVALAKIGERWLSYPLAGSALTTAADGVAKRVERGVAEVELFGSSAEAHDNVVVMGCAPALGLLAERLEQSTAKGRCLWVSTSSTRALEALVERRTHVAGVHLTDARTGEANVADVKKHDPSEPIALITLARWEAGFVTAPGNPKCIRSAEDLAQKSLRIVVRERGSGARRLLERELRRARVPASVLAKATLCASGHLEVAHAVALGAADVGVATRDAALAFDLGFVPIAEERYDLALPVASLTDPRLERLLNVITSGAFRRELSALGYDPTSSGQRVAEIRAA